MEHVWIVGIILVLAVLVQALWMAGDFFLRLRHQAAQRRGAISILEARLASARAHRQAEERRSLIWAGWRKFEVRQKTFENPNRDICSFYLSPHDGKSIPSYEPGQFLTFQLKIPGQQKPTVRCYSLSDAPQPNEYRVTIKRVQAPPGTDFPAGLASGYFHDHVREGTILDLKAPAGAFSLDTASSTPVVLIGGGVGVTPVLSMLNAIVSTGLRREIWFFYGVRHGGECIMKDHFETIKRAHPSIHVNICYSKPGEGDLEDRDYQHRRRVGIDLLKRVLPSSNFDFFLCGPAPMMDSLISDLEGWDIPRERIHFERFGPGAPRKVDAKPASDTDVNALEVNFTRSGKKASWVPAAGTLLDLARSSDIAIDSGCERGDCGTCQIAVRSGTVTYPEPPSYECEDGTCLACCSVPASALELDA